MEGESTVHVSQCLQREATVLCVRMIFVASATWGVIKRTVDHGPVGNLAMRTQSTIDVRTHLFSTVNVATLLAFFIVTCKNTVLAEVFCLSASSLQARPLLIY